MVKVDYQFSGGACTHNHPHKKVEGNPFINGWEWLTIAFESRSWFQGEVRAWLREKCAALGIPWLDFPPKSQASPALASLFGAIAVTVPEEEQERARRMWAAVQPGQSIFDDEHCSTPWCANYDAMAALLPKVIDVTIHAPTELLDAILSDLYDWNHEVK